MIHHSKKLTLATALSLAALPAAAVESASGFYIAPSVSYQTFDNGILGSDDTLTPVRPDGQTGFGLGLGYQFNSPWAVELAYHMANSEDEKTGVDIDTEYWHVDGFYHFEKSGSSWAPYLVAGVGQQKFSNDNNYDEDDAQLNAGVGIKYKMTSQFHFRSDVRATVGNDEADVGGLFNLGLVYIFGDASSNANDDAVEQKREQLAQEVNEQKAKASETLAEKAEDAEEVVEEKAEDAKEAGAAAIAAVVDSDNDGVDDNKDNCANTPEGIAVDANGCENDSDGDGVADSKDQCPNTTQDLKITENGCYADLTEAVSFKLDVNFASGSAELTQDSKASIDELADIMKQNVNAKVAVKGYTDSTGSAAFNQQLSQKRAESVKQALLEAGIEESRVTSEGLGEQDPVADNNTAEGRKANRRVMADISTK